LAKKYLNITRLSIPLARLSAPLTPNFIKTYLQMDKYVGKGERGLKKLSVINLQMDKYMGEFNYMFQ